MTVMVVPEIDEEPWPTLGPQVVERMEELVVFGPGSLRGEPYKLDQEKRALVYRAYEVYPFDHPRAGQRRFDRIVFQVRKGWAKSELGAAIIAVELDPDGPVRCRGWTTHRGERVPEGGPVRDPYIPVMAYTEEQSEDLMYYALLVMLDEGRFRHLFDIGLERIMRLGGDGKAVALATNPNARDGARTTHQAFDETHRLILPRQVQAHQTMQVNLLKRPEEQPWSAEYTTAFMPGQGSIAERTMDYANQIGKLPAGEQRRSRLFFFWRYAGPEHDITTDEGLRSAIMAASGPELGARTDVERVAAQWEDPGADRAYLERTMLNRTVQGEAQAFDADAFKRGAQEGTLPKGAFVTLGFDGSVYDDDTGLVATEIATGRQEVVGHWANPGTKDWKVPEDDVDARVQLAFTQFDVWRGYFDPHYWQSWISKWSGQFGEKRVIDFDTRVPTRMAPALQAYATAIKAGQVPYSAHGDFPRHIGHAVRNDLHFKDDRGEPMWTIRKERPDSPQKIDLAMAGVLSWQARLDAVSSGAKPASRFVAYVPRRKKKGEAKVAEEVATS